MKIRRVWIILNNGLPVINFDIDYDELDKVRIIRKEDIMQDLLQIGTISNFLNCLEITMQKSYDYFLFDNLLFKNYTEKIVHYQEGIFITYRIVIVAERDISKDFQIELNELTKFCRLISYDFYTEFKEEISVYSALNLSLFEKFKSNCKELIENLDNIDQEAEKRRINLKSDLSSALDSFL